MPHKFVDVYDVILDIDSYHTFVPLCSGSKILCNSNGHVIADLVINILGQTLIYRSFVYSQKNAVKIIANERTFSLCGHWVIEEIKPDLCVVSLTVEILSNYNFAQTLLNAIAPQILRAFLLHIKNKSVKM